MRGNIAVVSLLTAGVLAASPASAYAAVDPIPPRPPSPLAGLPESADNGQVVILADGDRYEVSYVDKTHSIVGRRWDAATRDWGPLRVIVKDGDLCIGTSVNVRAAGTAVAVRSDCQGYAAVSTDTVHWAVHKLSDRSSSSPAISPSGTHAAWVDGEEYLTWNATAGFVRHGFVTPDESAPGKPVITDDGTVTIAHVNNSCVVTFDTYITPGVPTRQVLPTPKGCEAIVVPIDAHAVVVGEGDGPWFDSTLTRPDDSSPWVVSAVAPWLAPGLMRDVYLPDALRPSLLDVPDLPLAMVGNASANGLGVQLFDPATQSWRPPTTLATRAGGTKCRSLDEAPKGLGFYGLHLTCAGVDRYVTSPDGGLWQALPIAAQDVGLNRELGLVAVPGRHQTVVLGRDSPAQTLPVGSDGGCDAVLPIAVDRLLRLTASKGSHGWPNLLQRSTAKGWRTIRRVPMPTEGVCVSVSSRWGSTPGFQFVGGGEAFQARFVKENGRWDVRVR